jgi:uroporphyrinogen III methyltransferase/synthase
MDGAQVLLARAAGARDVLPQELEARGAHVTDLPLYELRRPNKKTTNLDEILVSGIDIATFTSSSTVTGCLDLLGGKAQALEGVMIACIGPITARAAEKAGLQVDLVSKRATIPGLVSALENYFRNLPNTE